jgi:hypothetical protein
VKVYSKTEHSMAPEILVMSKVVWDKLPANEQAMIRAAAKESVAFERQKWDEQEAKSLASVKAQGAEIIEVDKKSFQAAMGPVYEKFMTTPDMKRRQGCHPRGGEAPGHPERLFNTLDSRLRGNDWKAPCTPASAPGCPSCA